MNKDTDDRKIRAENEANNERTIKTSHNRQPTTCQDLRRSLGACGICGSQNIVEQGVDYCEMCGKEKDFLKADRHAWYYSSKSEICKCVQYFNYGNNEIRTRAYSPQRSISVTKCADCGAVRSSTFCPNCSNKSLLQRGFYINNAWRHWDGRISCLKCGYREDNPVDLVEQKKITKKSKKKFSNRKKKRLAAKNQPHPNRIR
jgi:hypothetical protein